ncbi:MAG: D-tyrosyl-tRNA(Tyr) deacylase [Kaiparowitsia implicata GSE-PSE-MK54-09C]|nr:D-tyrosyl-tRNA(Tyr) deacylase [Kaiparowitsia implicata GSE-PSE-MK54-09C]
MRVVVQRVTTARVVIAGVTVGRIPQGLLLLVGIAATDTDAELDWMARKCLDLRLFPDGEAGRFDRSVREMGGALLVVSQFTLYGDCRKGRRPSFTAAAPPQEAEPRFDRFVALLRTSGLTVETGQFGAQMQVLLENDGPVTLVLERDAPG